MNFWDDAGGEPAVRAVVQELYDRLFDDPMVSFLFEGKDKAHLVAQQVRFTSGFLGGPFAYDGKPLPEAHARLPLLPGHFDRRHHLLRLILEKHAVPKRAAEEWLRVDEALRGSVVKSGEHARTLARKA
jgi:hemoglobin